MQCASHRPTGLICHILIVDCLVIMTPFLVQTCVNFLTNLHNHHESEVVYWRGGDEKGRVCLACCGCACCAIVGITQHTINNNAR